MLTDTLLIWNSLAMPVILGVSTFVGIMVYRFARRQAKMQALQLIHSRWQDINRSIIERPHVQRLLGDERFAAKTDDEIAAYNFVFQIVNSCYELHFASSSGLIDRAMAERFLDGNADILRGRSAEVLDILTWNRGYDEAFCNDIRRRLRPQP
ncbi:hypothetical protein ES707_16750 [subsurface metagenome]|jgi:hypothetical protein